MPNISIETDKVPASSGGLVSASQSTVYAKGKLVIVNGDTVASHGSSPHNAATMIAGSNNVFIGGVAVCNTGDAATCGDTIGPGADTVQVGD